ARLPRTAWRRPTGTAGWSRRGDACRTLEPEREDASGGERSRHTTSFCETANTDDFRPGSVDSSAMDLKPIGSAGSLHAIAAPTDSRGSWGPPESRASYSRKIVNKLQNGS